MAAVVAAGGSVAADSAEAVEASAEVGLQEAGEGLITVFPSCVSVHRSGFSD